MTDKTPDKTLTDGSPIPADGSHLDIIADGPQAGQQTAYVVLSEAERAKGFVRPVRRSYRHVGPPGPTYPLRDLTAAELARFGDRYVKYEPYPDERRPALGRFWTKAELDAIGKGCRTVTIMGDALAETYARDPAFYGATFCCGCSKHLPIGEFVWDGTTERVGS